MKGDLYDLVLNGNEVASVPIRIHDPEIQKRTFAIVGFSIVDEQQLKEMQLKLNLSENS